MGILAAGVILSRLILCPGPVLHAGDGAVDPDKVSPYVVDRLQAADAADVEVYLIDPIERETMSPDAFTHALLEFDLSSTAIRVICPGVFTATLSHSEVARLSREQAVVYIAPSILLYPAGLEQAVQIIDADLTWQQQIEGINLTGQGHVVCMLDTGRYCQELWMKA